MQVFVRDNNVDQALRILKRRMQREGVFKEMRRRRFYEKPSDKTAREKTEAIRRMRKQARKQAIRDGLIAAPVKKPSDGNKRGTALRPNSIAGTRQNEPTPTQAFVQAHDRSMMQEPSSAKAEKP
ncbi:30S ribosomal protein S21 [Bradyrhizobium cenepequi]|uniref:30S ribosomal protein S21 n=1 Tax=Bradyrhizobium cenepequi TaxID=2821403 RepID=UPI001CE352F4|nr:30S ribosomal protein S21 [Bradyrhizobium cenepequi]